jgi:hypothetical protein
MPGGPRRFSLAVTSEVGAAAVTTSAKPLEAIFLSTFVMISQNRADAKRQVIANQQWQTVKEEDKQNEELLNLSNEILKLTKAIHSSTKAGPEGAPLPKS